MSQATWVCRRRRFARQWSHQIGAASATAETARAAGVAIDDAHAAATHDVFALDMDAGLSTQRDVGIATSVEGTLQLDIAGSKGHLALLAGLCEGLGGATGVEALDAVL